MFVSGRAALWQKELQIKYLGQDRFYPLEAKLKIMSSEMADKVSIWAAYGCSRNLSVDPSLPDLDQMQSSPAH